MASNCLATQSNIAVIYVRNIDGKSNATVNHGSDIIVEYKYDTMDVDKFVIQMLILGEGFGELYKHYIQKGRQY